MDSTEFGVLQACQEYTARQQEMLPHLAAALGVEERQVFYTWANRRSFARGKLLEANWTYFFHGLECDLKNQRDGRFLRMDFGPHGTVGILNDGGVLRFIMTSVSPWGEFPGLKSYFKKNDPPFDEYSGDWNKMSRVWDTLETQGCFEMADRELVDLQAKYTTRGPDGLNYVCFPADISEETRADCKVAHRQRLTLKAIELLRTAKVGNIVSAIRENSSEGDSRNAAVST